MLWTTGRGVPSCSSVGFEFVFGRQLYLRFRMQTEAMLVTSLGALCPLHKRAFNPPPKKSRNAQMDIRAQPISNPHCILCGIHLLGMKRRVFNQVEGQSFVRKLCKPTPFLHTRLSSQSVLPGKHFMCIPCVNWKRRIAQGSRRRFGRPMLQLDQMILFLLQPGRHPEPDMRCMKRLVKAVRQPGNPYLPLFPAPVRWIVSRIRGNTYADCVVAWWEYNGRTEFFASAHEARRVRCALKGGHDDASTKEEDVEAQ